MGIHVVIERMRAALDRLEAAGDPRRYFLGVYLRTIIAVREEVLARGFRDGQWVERWDVAFAELSTWTPWSGRTAPSRCPSRGRWRSRRPDSRRCGASSRE
jgi:hypothetical protein